MTSKRTRGWLRIAALVILLFIIAYGLVALEQRRKGRQGPPRRTTYSTAPGGYKALYKWLKTLEVPVERWEKDLQEIPRDATVLLLAQPEIGLGTKEKQGLKEWIGRGGTLVLAASPPNPLLEHFGLEAERGEDAGWKETAPVQPSPYNRGVTVLTTRAYFGVRPSRPDGVVHIRGPDGIGLMAVIQEGEGRVIVLSDPGLFSNQHLRKNDHARLALNLLLLHLGEGRVLVDEYHHGYGRASTVLAHFARSRFSAPSLQVFILILLFLLAGGIRFGPARPVKGEERRSSLEYVQAMAGLLRRAGARTLALEGIIHRVAEEARRALVDSDRSFQAALKDASAPRRKDELTDRELLVTARGLYRALKQAQRRAPGV